MQADVPIAYVVINLLYQTTSAWRCTSYPKAWLVRFDAPQVQLNIRVPTQSIPNPTRRASSEPLTASTRRVLRTSIPVEEGTDTGDRLFNTTYLCRSRWITLVQICLGQMMKLLFVVILDSFWNVWAVLRGRKPCLEGEHAFDPKSY